MKRIAILGGTFDPVHKGHLFIAEEARRQADLDRVIFVPCWQSPHKPDIPVTTPEHRLAMLRLATAGLPWAEVSSWETDRAVPSPSWITAEYFRTLYPPNEAELFWIVGADQWMKIEQWTRVEHLATLIRFLVFARETLKPLPKPGFSAQFLTGTIDISATEIRLTTNQATFREDLPAGVFQYVEQHGLYGFGESRGS